MKLQKNAAGMYVVRFKTPNGSKSLTTKCSSIEEARKVVKESGIESIEVAAKAGRLSRDFISQVVVGRKLTVAQVSNQWKEWLARNAAPRTAYCTHLSFLRFAREAKVQSLPPSGITEDMVYDWINDPNSSRKLGSRLIDLSAVRNFFKYCLLQGYCFRDPSQLVRIDYDQLSHEQKEATIRLPFTDEEVEKLLANTTGFWHVAIALGRWTGLRLSDIAGLEWACLAEQGKLKVWMDKTNRPIEIVLNPQAAEALGRISFSHPQFCFPKERKLARLVTKRSNLSVQFLRICNQLGIKGKSFHCLRHTRAATLQQQGKSLDEIRVALGHTDQQATKRYCH